MVREDGAVVARYEYGPFAEMVRSSGPWADANSFTFSTKQLDTETGLLYYGYRYYSPTLGRWISRDPIEEKGGNHLYGFCGNNALWAVDIDGRDYYVVQREGKSGIKHQVVIGDDGAGNTYEFDMSPAQEKWWEHIYRLSGPGKIEWGWMNGPASDWLNDGEVVKRYSTTREQDELLSQAAQRLDNTGFWYFLGIQDCRSADNRLREEVRQVGIIGRVFNRIITAVPTALGLPGMAIHFLLDEEYQGL